MAVNLKPLGDRVLVEPSEEKETKKGGIIIPDSAKEKPTESLAAQRRFGMPRHARERQQGGKCD